MKVEPNLQRPAGLLAEAVRLLRLRGQEGGSLVEFAVALPLLMVVLTGAASFTLAFYSLQQLGNATASAVELIAAQQGVTTDPCNLAMTTVQSTLPGWTAANLSYTLTITDSANNAIAYPSSSYGGSTAYSCTAAGSSGADAEYPDTPVVLQVNYNYTWIPVFHFGSFLKFAPSSALTVTETAMAD